MKSRSEEGTSDQNNTQVAHIKQGWAQLKTLHCDSLPEKIVNHGSKSFKRIQIEMLAHRWQHHCLLVIIKLIMLCSYLLSVFKKIL